MTAVDVTYNAYIAVLKILKREGSPKDEIPLGKEK